MSALDAYIFPPRVVSAENLVKTKHTPFDSTSDVLLGATVSIRVNAVCPDNTIHLVYISSKMIETEAVFLDYMSRQGQDVGDRFYLLEAHAFEAELGDTLLLVLSKQCRVFLVGLGDVYTQYNPSVTLPRNLKSDFPYLTSEAFAGIHKEVGETLVKYCQVKVSQDKRVRFHTPTIAIHLPCVAILNSYSEHLYGNARTCQFELNATHFMNTKDQFYLLFSQLYLSQHFFDLYLTDAHDVKKRRCVDFIVLGDICKQSVWETMHLCESSAFTRELVNERSDVMHCAKIVDICTELVQTHKDILTLHYYNTDELASMGYNLIVSVGQGSQDNKTSRIAIIEYSPLQDPTAEVNIALVGKTITFDTGGLNLKLADHGMEDMHMDMGGGGAVLGAMRSLALLRPHENRIIGALAIAENAIDSNCVKPSSIIQTNQIQDDGTVGTTTVCVIDTDAEGRNALADTLTLVQCLFRPKHIVDIATLTYTVLLALGDQVAGVFSNDELFATNITKLGYQANEPFWILPVYPSHFEGITGTDSDLINCAPTNRMDCNYAAAFLMSFIQHDTKYAHLDIAGPVWFSEVAPEENRYGATGFAATTLYKLVQYYK